jgi:hypothetical protein
MYYVLKDDFMVRIGDKRNYIYNKINMSEKYEQLNDDAVMILKRVNEGDSYYNMINNLITITGENVNEIEKPVINFLNNKKYFDYGMTP